ncbi:MAG TPA: nuclear transport factor 2 family protein [Kofleriaceae bacterium]|nr:nuclear transport factor 2 family protein [Kofleriaceae bacterium]
MTARDLVLGYFTAWTTKRSADAFALLAPDLEFSGPGATYKTSAEFRPGLEAFAQMTRSATLLELLVDGDRVAMLYDWEMPLGTIRIASFFRVKDGKIRWYDTRFDPTKLNELRAQRPQHRDPP